jgi:enoyl-CoA hydratase
VRPSAIDSRVLIVKLNRPDRRNAVDRPTAEALYSAFRDFDANDKYHVAILTGSDDVFCAGADLKAIAAGGAEMNQLESVESGAPGPMGVTRLRLGKPVIAAIAGPAVAGGLELAVWADMRVAAEDAVLGVYCRRPGVPLIDGGTVRLPRLIGFSRAMDLICEPRVTI